MKKHYALITEDDAKMKEHERKLLNRIQSNIPLESRPYSAIGKELNMTEEEVILTIIKLKQQGYVRRIGGIFDSKSLGFISVLCAAEVPEAYIDLAAQSINSLSGVTHNYLRNHRYNIWFTLTVPSESMIKETINWIKSETGIENIICLKAAHTYKIQVNFKLEGENKDGQ